MSVELQRPLLTGRDRLAWVAGFLIVAALLVATKFVSHDADSIRYATLSARLSALPVSRWVAPEWWGLTTTDLSGYFLEHPAGLFFIPAALGRLGIAPEQAPYIFGVAGGLAALLLTAVLIARLAGRDEGRAALALLQIMPVAFIFRVRDNHEYPMLVCLLLTLIGLDRVTRSWRWAVLVAAAFVSGLLIKGVFVAIVGLGAALWIAINPTNGSRSRQVAACLLGGLCMIVVGLAYDAWYVRETGGPFWSAYLSRQLGQVEVSTPTSQARSFVQHAAFYLARLVFHPAPWSLALVWAAFRRRASQSTEERAGLRFVLAFTAIIVLALSLSSRFAERYLFSATFLTGAAGAALAYRESASLRRWMASFERRVPAFPAVLWTLLIVLRLAVGPWLPRLGG